MCSNRYLVLETPYFGVKARMDVYPVFYLPQSLGFAPGAVGWEGGGGEREFRSD
jgi:hypothetical protein